MNINDCKCGGRGRLKTEAPFEFVRCEYLLCENRSNFFRGIFADDEAIKDWNEKNPKEGAGN